MATILPKLDHVLDIVTDEKKPSQTFQRWWQKVAETLQKALAAIEANVLEIQEVLGLTQETRTIVDNGLNPDGTVKADKVTTDSIVAGAVLATPTINNTSSTTITSGSYTWTDCDDFTFTSTGHNVILMCDFNIEVVDNCKYKYRLRHSGATLGREVGPVTANTADQPPGTIVRVFTPSAGSVTVTLQAACNDANDIIVHDPVFVVMENRNV